MLARRLLILLAVLMGLTALAAGVAPRQPAVETGGSPTPSPKASAPPSKPLERTLDAESSGQRVVARVGQTVILTIRSEVLDSVSLAEFGIETTEPDSPARFELRADVPGEYALDLLEADRTIGTLEIRPAAG